MKRGAGRSAKLPRVVKRMGPRLNWMYKPEGRKTFPESPNVWGSVRQRAPHRPGAHRDVGAPI